MHFIDPFLHRIVYLELVSEKVLPDWDREEYRRLRQKSSFDRLSGYFPPLDEEIERFEFDEASLSAVKKIVNEGFCPLRAHFDSSSAYEPSYTLNDISGIERCKNLERFHYSFTSVDVFPLVALNKLENVTVKGSCKNLKLLTRLPKLQYLTLRGMSVEKPSFFHELEALRNLTIRCTKTDYHANVKTFDKLRKKGVLVDVVTVGDQWADYHFGES